MSLGIQESKCHFREFQAECVVLLTRFTKCLSFLVPVDEKLRKH